MADGMAQIVARNCFHLRHNPGVLDPHFGVVKRCDIHVTSDA